MVDFQKKKIKEKNLSTSGQKTKTHVFFGLSKEKTGETQNRVKRIRKK